MICWILDFYCNLRQTVARLADADGVVKRLLAHGDLVSCTYQSADLGVHFPKGEHHRGVTEKTVAVAGHVEVYPVA